MLIKNLFYKFKISQSRYRNIFYFFSGFPRTSSQAEALGKNQDVDLVINLDVPFDTIRQRLEVWLVYFVCLFQLFFNKFQYSGNVKSLLIFPGWNFVKSWFNQSYIYNNVFFFHTHSSTIIAGKTSIKNWNIFLSETMDTCSFWKNLSYGLVASQTSGKCFHIYFYFYFFQKYRHKKRLMESKIRIGCRTYVEIGFGSVGPTIVGSK